MAAVSRRDEHHEDCRRLIESYEGALVVPVTVAVEVDYLLRARVGVESARAFLRDLSAGRYVLESVDANTLERARELDLRHADADLGLVDASVVASAERLGAEAIFTLDRSHFLLASEGQIRLLPE